MTRRHAPHSPPRGLRLVRIAVLLLLGTGSLAPQDTPPSSRFLPVGLFIGSIEEGARIFTPARLLPLEHPEAGGHEFPTVLQLHQGEYPLLVLLGRHAGLLLEPDTTWPYRTFSPPPVARFERVTPTVRPAAQAPLPGLRAVTFLDGAPVAFIVDTRHLTLAQWHLDRPTAIGLDVSRADFLAALTRAGREVSGAGAAVIVYQD